MQNTFTLSKGPPSYHFITACPLLGIYPRKMKIYVHTKISTQMNIICKWTLFITVPKQKQPNCASSGWWINKLCCIYTMDCSTPGHPVHHQYVEIIQTHDHLVGDAIQPYYPLLSLSPYAFKLSKNRGFFKWVSPLHQVAKVLEFQLHHQSFQRILRTDFF